MSAAQPLISATTAAVATQQQVESGTYAYIVLGADNLAGAEECDIYVKNGNTWTVLSDLGGNPVKLTLTVPNVRVDGGPIYGVTKDATAGACGVWWTPASRLV